MQKNILIIIVCLILAFSISACNKKNEQPKSKQNTYLEKSFKKEWLKNVDFNIYNLTADSIDYLKTKSEFKEDYFKGKKIIIYPSNVGSCPYGQAFLTYMEETKNNSKNEESYIYHPRQYDGYMTIEDEDLDKIKQQGFEVPSNLIVLNKKYTKQEQDFRKTCSIVCIINPKRNQVLSFDGAGPSLGVKLQGIFDQLKDW